MFIHRYFYKFLSLLAFCYYFLTSNIWTSLIYILNPLKLNKNLHNEIVNNKSTLFLTLINNWKKPNHLVLIIGEDVILYNDITQIILWCMIAGVSFVSVYDYKNRLSHYNLLSAIKNNPLFEEFNKLTLGFSFNKLTSNSKTQDTLILNTLKTSKAEPNGIHKYYADDIVGILNIIEESKKKNTDQNLNSKHLYTNGLNGDSNFRKEYSNGPPCCIGDGITDGSNNKIHEKFDHPLTADLKWSNYKTELNILSRKQCESDLLNSIVELGETNLSVSDTIMKERLQEKCPLPDPEVAIVIGRKLSSYGLLPWNIRLTEFFQFDNYYDISASKFKNILRKYSKCEQRYGK